MVDPAAAVDSAVQAHERRRVRIVRKDGEVRIHGRFGAAEGEALAAIHDRFAQREFDVDAAVASDGELPRSADQRSADALAAALRTADDWFSHDETACAACGAPVPTPTGSREPLTNLVFDEESFRQWASGDAPEGPIDLDRLLRFAAGTADGAPVPADDIVRSMILGRVRVVVRRSDGVITYVGRRQRLFRGLLREAVVLQHPNCTWPGCGVPGSHCEADHLQPHVEGGATEAVNGGPLCDHHNRFKAEHGYRTERGTDGRWHVLRPDGTSITGPPSEQDQAEERRADPDAA